MITLEQYLQIAHVNLAYNPNFAKELLVMGDQSLET